MARLPFQESPEYIRRLGAGSLQLSSDALSALESNSELASVETTNSDDDEDFQSESQFTDVVQPALESGMTEHNVYAFDKNAALYLRHRDFLKIKKAGKIELVYDDVVRRPVYSSPANIAFPHLYPNGETSAVDIGDYKLGFELLRKQTLFGQKTGCGTLCTHLQRMTFTSCILTLVCANRERMLGSGGTSRKARGKSLADPSRTDSL